jgi:hypothetical protein
MLVFFLTVWAASSRFVLFDKAMFTAGQGFHLSVYGQDCHDTDENLNLYGSLDSWFAATG